MKEAAKGVQFGKPTTPSGTVGTVCILESRGDDVLRISESEQSSI